MSESRRWSRRRAIATRCLALTVWAAGIAVAGCGQGISARPPVPSYRVSGTVNGAVLADVTLSLEGAAAGSTTTDGNGNYAFTGLVNGSYTVTPGKSGYSFSPPMLSVTVSGADVTGQDFAATAPPISYGYSISGTVIGATQADVTISWAMLNGTATGSTTTDGSGNYTISGLVNGGYNLTPSKSGYMFSPWSVSLGISDADVTGQNFTAYAWSSVPSGTTNALYGIWGSSASDIWAVGASGTILHWNGSAWSSVTSGTKAGLNAVWGSGPSDVWTVGSGGIILHWNGSAWSSEPSGTTDGLRGVWGSSATEVWAVGGGSAGRAILK